MFTERTLNSLNREETGELKTSENLVEKAHRFVQKKHHGQMRKSGEPYVSHLEAVSAITKDEWGIGNETLISAALLHDVLEDTDTTTKEITEEFGEDVARLVDGVSKFKSGDGEESDFETLRKVVTLTAVEPRVSVLKLSDRLHNMRTLQHMSDEKKIEKSRETMYVYVPLAESLGMWKVKTELEDLAFKYLHPEDYQRVKDEVDSDPRQDEGFLTSWSETLTKLLRERGIKGEVVPRKNGYYALEHKRNRGERRGEFSGLRNINDLVSFRVILDDLESCYLLKKYIHIDSSFANLINFERYDEFVGSNKRANGYSAIQTTVETNSGSVEIALATSEMEEFNNWGVVSLLRKNAPAEQINNYVLKLVFTPIGEVRFLPTEAKIIDMAYAINPMLGASAEYAFVDGERVELLDTVPHGATVEIAFDNYKTAPNPELLPFALPQTQVEINGQLLLAERARRAEEGMNILSRVFTDRALIDLSDLEKDIYPYIVQNGCTTLEEFYWRVAGGQIDLEKLIAWIDNKIIEHKQIDETWILISGQNETGILEAISRQIRKANGDIVSTRFLLEDGRYKLRFVAVGLKPKKIKKIGKYLGKHERFEKWTVI